MLRSLVFRTNSYLSIQDYATQLRSCADAQDLDRAKLLHARLLSLNLSRDRFLSNLLVYMYGQCGDLLHACQVFDTISKPNLYSWTVLITAYAHNGEPRLAFQLYCEMLLEGVKLDGGAFVAVLTACTATANFSTGKCIHENISISGCDSSVVVANSLVNMYGKCGRVKEARQVFERIEPKSVVSWNSIMSAYAQNGHSEEVWKLYERMEVPADEVTYVSVLDSCAASGDLLKGKTVHRSAQQAGLDSDSLVSTSLVHMYSSCGSLADARLVFDRMEESRSLGTWNAMISAYEEAGLSDEALLLYWRMSLEGVQLNSVTFLAVLGSCSCVTRGKHLHLQVSGSKFHRDVVVNTAVVSMYGACGDVENARLVFDSVIRVGSSHVAWNAMLTVYVENGHSTQALQLFRQMDKEGVKKDEVTYMSVFHSDLEIQAARELHAQAANTGFILDLRVCTAAISMFGKCGSVTDAKEVFDGIRVKDGVCYCSFISACSQNGRYEQAMSCYRELVAAGSLAPDRTTFATILDACSGLRSLKDGKDVHERIVLSKTETDTVLLNALVNMYAKCGSLEDAVKVFRECEAVEKDAVTWNSLIDAHASCGLPVAALELYLEMKVNGIQPSEVTLIIVLSACSHAGLAVQGWREFVSMEQDYGVRASTEHYSCIVDLLGRLGSLEDAWKTLKLLPGSSVAYTSFLSWCSKIM